MMSRTSSTKSDCYYCGQKGHWKKDQTGLPVPYILEPYRTVPCIFETNRHPARNFRARAEPKRGPNARARQCTVRIVYETNRINLWNAQFGTAGITDGR